LRCALQVENTISDSQRAGASQDTSSAADSKRDTTSS